MPRSLELIFDPKVRNTADVQKLEATIDSVAQKTGLSTGNLRAFNEVLGQTAQRTGGYTSAVRELASQSSIFQQFAKQLQATLKEQQKAEEQAASAATKAAGDFEKAKAREAAAAKKAADEIIKQHERVQTTIGRIGARIGGSTLGIPGGGFAASSLVGGLGLSGGAALGLGGAAAGIFGAVELAKQIDQVAKWAQQQKNAAAEVGITVTEMENLSRVSERTGVDMQGVAKSVSSMSGEMWTSTARAKEISSALSQLGLSSSVAFETPTKGIQDIAGGLAGVADPLQRTRLAVELLGNEGRKFVANLEGIQNVSAKGIIDAKTMDQLSQAHEQLVEFSQSWDVLKADMATPIVGLLRVNRDWSPTAGEMQNQGRALAGVQIERLRPGANATGDLEAHRAEEWRSYALTHGTPEDRYRASIDQIETERKNLQDRFSSGAISSGEMQHERASLDAREAAAQAQRKSDDEYRSQVQRFQEQFGGGRWRDRAPVDSADVLRQYGELNKSFNLLGNYAPFQNWMGQLRGNIPGAAQNLGRDMINRQFPGLATGDDSRLYSPMGKINEEFQHDLERRTREATRSQEDIKKDQKQRLDDITAGARDTTEDTESAIRLRSAIESGARRSRGRDLGTSGIAQLDLEDQLKVIQENFAAKAGPITGAITQQQNELGIAVEPSDKDAIQRQIDNERAELQKLQNDRLTQGVDALSKFNDSVDEASKKLKDEFGSFAEGLFSAGLKGKAGTYSRNFFIGQGEKAVGNLASSIYVPGMLSLPGQGTPEDPTFLGRMLKGTLFQQDPKAQGALATTDNTSATVDNTKATLALAAAMGVDPSSLGITGTGGVSLPTLAGSVGSGGLLGQVQALSKGLGITLPGLPSVGTRSRGGGSLMSGNPALASLFKMFPSLFSGGGDQSNAIDAYLGANSGVMDTGSLDFPDAFSYSDSGLSFPALGVGADAGGGLSYPALGLGSSSGDNFQSQVSDSIGSAFSSDQVSQSVGSSFARAVAGEIPATSGGLTSQQDSTIRAALSGGSKGIGGGFGSSNPTALGMGLQAAGGAFGAYTGISEMTKGGAQNIAGGLGTTLMSIAPFTGPAAPFLAAAGMVSSLVSAFMGDPRANRQKALTEEEIANTYTAPTPLNVTTNANGMMTTTDYRGKVESLGTLPSVSSVNTILGFDPYNQNHVLSSAGWQLSPSGMVPPSQRSAPAAGAPIQITQHISAMDSQSIMDRGPDIANALIPVLQGTHRISNEIQRVVNG